MLQRATPLAGGSGRVLDCCPGLSPMQKALLRCQGTLFDPRPIVVGADAHRLEISGQVHELELVSDILTVPEGHGSCAMMAAGCLHAMSRDPDGVVVASLSSRFAPDPHSLSKAVEESLWDVDLGFVVAFGIRPDRAASDCDYILPGSEPYGVAHGFHSFLQSPDTETAMRCVAEGWLWSSDHLVFKASALLEDLRRLVPEILEPVRQSLEKAWQEAPFLRLDPRALSEIPALAFKDAIFERTRRSAVIQVNGSWVERSMRSVDTKLVALTE